MFKFEREQLKFEVSSILPFDSDRADLEHTASPRQETPSSSSKALAKKKGQKKKFWFGADFTRRTFDTCREFVSTGNRTRICRELRFFVAGDYYTIKPSRHATLIPSCFEGQMSKEDIFAVYIPWGVVAQIDLEEE